MVPWLGVVPKASLRAQEASGVAVDATGAGSALPLWFGGDPLFVSMAVAILLRLVFATMLTLGFVPAPHCPSFRVRYP